MSKKTKTSQPVKSTSKSKQSRKARQKNRNWLWVGLGIIFLAVLAALLLIPKSTQSNEISATLAYQKYQQGAFFLDVRSQDEYDQAHIDKSTLVPLDDLQNRLDELPRDRDIVVVCLSGHRSKEGMTILLNAGFSQVSCITGGLTAWKAAGLPLVGSNSQ
jgi:rhodanese-related sulfurtransferase